MGTRLFHHCQQQKQSLTFLADHLNSPSVLTVWVDEQPHQLLPHKAQAPFAVFPSQFKMQPNTPQKTVLMYLGTPEACPKTQEAVYYLYFLETPLKALKQPNATQYLSMVKLFLRPPQLPSNSDGQGRQLSIAFDAQAAQFILSNPTPYYVTISRWQGASGATKPLAEPVMVPPNSTLRHQASTTALVNPYQNLVITTLDDFGRSHSSTHRLRLP